MCTELAPPHQLFKMLLTTRIITIFVSAICFVLGMLLIVLGLLEKPVADWGAVWVGAIIVLFYLANLYLLYRSYKKKHGPTHWVALILSILPPLCIFILTLLADNISF